LFSVWLGLGGTGVLFKWARSMSFIVVGWVLLLALSASITRAHGIVGT